MICVVPFQLVRDLLVIRFSKVDRLSKPVHNVSKKLDLTSKPSHRSSQLVCCFLYVPPYFCVELLFKEKSLSSSALLRDSLYLQADAERVWQPPWWCPGGVGERRGG